MIRITFALVFAGVLGLALEPQRGEPTTLTADLHHLGDDRVPEWTDSSVEPEGTRLELAFDARAGTAYTLELEQRDVHRSDWRIQVGDRTVATLERELETSIEYYAIPADAVVDGANRLAIVAGDGEDGYDDVVVGRARLYTGTVRDVFELGRFRVDVRERGSGVGLPTRLTVVAADGTFAPIWFGERPDTAIRDGIAYTLSGSFEADLPAGRYTVWASKGVEWSRARAELVVDRRGTDRLVLELERQVDTRGWIAADTHLHTYTFSGHGDSSVEERVVTLAAEGVELAIATDHNHQLDYAPYQRELDAGAWFTPVVGNEVTTSLGHFNAFPLDPDGALPDHRLADWVALVDDIRAKGAGVVILNHPRWPYENDSPFALFGLDPRSGERDGPRFTFDCLELVNSTTRMADPLSILSDWFGVLNGGERVFAVGSSDSHTVADPVGQGRTYVRSSTDDAAAIDVAEACRSFRTGRISVSYGIVCDLAVVTAAGRFGLGDLARLPAREGGARAVVRLRAPDWVRPRSARLFANGVEIARRAVPRADGPTDVELDFPLRLERDAHVVAAVLGDPVEEPFWHALNNGYTFAATNPVFVDIDGDGRCDDPHRQAAALLAAHAAEPAAIAEDTSVDDPTLVQVVRLAREAVAGGALPAERERALVRAARARRSTFVDAYLDR